VRALPKQFLLLFFGLCLLPYAALAQGQDPGLKLSLSRNFGYAGGGRIQGRFTVSVEGPDDITSVSFWIDKQLMGVVSEPPYRHSFSTGDYELGLHTLYASAETSGGVHLESETISREFVGAETSWQDAMKLAGPILLATLVLLVLGSVLPALTRRGKPFEPGQYGAAGGAVCRHCRMPFSRSILAPNLVAGKLERCPHCRKWAIASRASKDQLSAAEARYRQDAHEGEVVFENAEDETRRRLEESRFEE
jgi:hypothetical protein